MKIIGLRKIWYLLSGILVCGSIAAVAIFGLKQGIDFKGGSLLSVRFDGNRPSPIEVEQALGGHDLGAITVQPVGEQDINVRLKALDEQTHQEVLQTLNEKYGSVTELQFNSIGPAIGKELRQKSIYALAIVFFAILIYVAWAFRKVSAPIQSWKYGIITIITAFHDVIVPVGLFAVLGKYYGTEIGTPFIAAILTIMGYSINDTIVVLDRVRENLQRTGGLFSDIVENSVKQTLLRSLNTSLTTLLAMTAVYLFGGESIKDFALALIVGVATGAYSSIFIASPLLVTWNKWDLKRKKR
ncbi:protein translocase subunit SecF [Patescibacteria group bacterium]|nr:protein translocase subunit SecF [Patescibacteria group bacterium]MBU1035010.1 protein translocase subunit SecF [Patescibacteria group bacterium]MBU1629778.1 protein translocase subunit SecF [Patescibacteria group bacterium]MBU1908230.1 protein translocase subunit SecF [Patescibacteria group bacterium]